ncbi:hypothetical protein [Alicyclobacillus fodiniaquatilis]|uniref:Peptidase M41 domain-containing protein n=1 Tax=Alicyclobacillus fodiniaquatilis TaxID=1661150 RepID=A0ABW4JC38_9BACL
MARAAEEEFLGKKLNGVTSDLQQATEIAGAYLGLVGMGDELFSWLAIGSRIDGLKALRPKINELLKDQMAQVKQLLQEHAEFVHKIANQLLKQGDLTGEEVEQIYVRLYGRNRPEPYEIKQQAFGVSHAAKATENEEESDEDSEHNPLVELSTSFENQ